MNTRTAPLHFDPDRELGDDVLKRILHLATLSPSADNLQPWRFLVVRSKARREALRRCAHGHPAIGDAPVVVIVLGYHHPHRSHLESIVEAQVQSGALPPSMAREITARTVRAMESRASPELWATRSAMLAAASLMGAARSSGVKSIYLDDFEHSKVRDTFGIPDDHAVCCLISLGYALGEPPSTARLGLDKVCYLEHFGQPWTLGEA